MWGGRHLARTAMIPLCRIWSLISFVWDGDFFASRPTTLHGVTGSCVCVGDCNAMYSVHTYGVLVSYEYGTRTEHWILSLTESMSYCARTLEETESA